MCCDDGILCISRIFRFSFKLLVPGKTNAYEIFKIQFHCTVLRNLNVVNVIKSLRRRKKFCFNFAINQIKNKMRSHTAMQAPTKKNELGVLWIWISNKLLNESKWIKEIFYIGIENIRLGMRVVYVLINKMRKKKTINAMS